MSSGFCPYKAVRAAQAALQTPALCCSQLLLARFVFLKEFRNVSSGFSNEENEDAFENEDVVLRDTVQDLILEVFSNLNDSINDFINDFTGQVAGLLHTHTKRGGLTCSEKNLLEKEATILCASSPALCRALYSSSQLTLSLWL